MRLIGDNYFDWATWSAVSIDGSAALSVAAAISSDNFGRKPVRGVEEAFRFRVANVSVRRISLLAAPVISLSVG